MINIRNDTSLYNCVLGQKPRRENGGLGIVVHCCTPNSETKIALTNLFTDVRRLRSDKSFRWFDTFLTRIEMTATKVTATAVLMR